MKNLVNFDKKPANFAKLPRTHERRESTNKAPDNHKVFCARCYKRNGYTANCKNCDI